MTEIKVSGDFSMLIEDVERSLTIELYEEADSVFVTVNDDSVGFPEGVIDDEYVVLTSED